MAKRDIAVDSDVPIPEKYPIDTGLVIPNKRPKAWRLIELAKEFRIKSSCSKRKAASEVSKGAWKDYNFSHHDSAIEHIRKHI